MLRRYADKSKENWALKLQITAAGLEQAAAVAELEGKLEAAELAQQADAIQHEQDIHDMTENIVGLAAQARPQHSPIEQREACLPWLPRRSCVRPGTRRLARPRPRQLRLRRLRLG